MESALHILLKRFRRRLVFAQVARLLAVASVAVAAACLVAALIQRLTGTALLTGAAMVSGLGTVVWILIRLRRRATLAAAALEIDRQRDLRELLSSAILAEEGQGFGACVIAAAVEKAAAVRIETLNAGSHGAPMWAAALLLAGLLPLVYRAPSSASEGISTDVLETAAIADSRPAAVAPRRASPQPDLIGPPQTPEASALAAASAVEDARGRPVASPRPTRSDTAGVSAGGGLAQGGQSTPGARPAADTSAQGEHGRGNAAGSGNANPGVSGTAAGRGQVSGAGEQAGTAADGAERMQGNGHVDAQSVPEGYRDVLKAYFAR